MNDGTYRFRRTPHAPPRQADTALPRDWLTPVVASLFVFLWLFLPPGELALGSFSLRKVDAVRLLPLAIVLLLNRHRLRVRWHWIDLPVLLFCLCPLLSGLANDLGWTQSGWETVKEFAYWFAPYFLGRAMFADPPSQRTLAIVIVAAAACYLPPTVFEIFNGPVLTAWVTGQELSRQALGADRGTTYRPSVFLTSGFVLTMFYVLATLAAVAVAWGEQRGNRFKVGMGVLAVVFALSVLACRSLGSIVLLGVGLTVLCLVRWTNVRGWLIPLALLAPLYIGARVSGLLRTEHVRVVAEQVVSKDRAGSLVYRLRAEDIVFDRMAGQWWLGFGDFGRWRQGGNVLGLDGFWLFALTRTGMLSVAAWLAMVTVPILLIAIRDNPRATVSPWIGLAFATFLALSLIDSMLNYFGAAPQMLVVGALAGQARFAWHSRAAASILR